MHELTGYIDEALKQAFSSPFNQSLDLVDLFSSICMCTINTLLL